MSSRHGLAETRCREQVVGRMASRANNLFAVRVTCVGNGRFRWLRLCLVLSWRFWHFCASPTVSVISVRGMVLNRVRSRHKFNKENKSHEIRKRCCEGREHAKYVVSTGHPGGGSS